MARAVWIVAGILLSLALWLLAHIAAGTRAEPERSARALQEVPARVELVPPSTEEVRQQADADVVPAADEARGPVRPPREAYVAAEPPTIVEGVCTVLDEEGTMHAHESGELRLVAGPGEDSASRCVDHEEPWERRVSLEPAAGSTCRPWERAALRVARAPALGPGRRPDRGRAGRSGRSHVFLRPAARRLRGLRRARGRARRPGPGPERRRARCSSA